ncbi:hypothetical protein SOCEGT47_043710 [Sorangium cellulosum]|uniref:Secreted protein n=1 Tax=Sorangium cellulosum TaxID=56 RepID=A0A4P2Q3W1_SORCE|nr:hypothetical protein [Sorangium cellulosum]AUX23841.1 hypothetical protein SOCEGT47_043710 [Sorangium cellulosum]
MNRFRFIAGSFFLAGHLFALGCGAPRPEPEIASSATQSGYAGRYPAELQAAAASFSEREDLAKRATDQLDAYPDQLEEPDWKEVLDVIEQADAAGRSHDYVERVRAVDGAVAFFNDNQDELTRRVSGAAQYVVKQKGCEADVTGATSRALEDGVERQLEEYVRARNEAHRRIERYRASLGKENAAVLEKQADAVSFTSYLVHIDLVERKLRLRRMLEEMETIKTSIDEAIEAERAFQASGRRTDDEKKASEARIEELGRSKAMLDSSATQAKQIDETMEERIEAAQKAYREAFARLRSTLRKNAGLPADPSEG